MNSNEARDQILGVFKDAWDDTGYPALYTDIPGGIPQEEGPWARALVRHVTGQQASLAGESGARRWRETGIVIVQVFAPVGDGMVRVYELAQLVKNAFRDAKNLDVWFRNTRIKEVGTSGSFEQINVTTDFIYDDVR